MIYIILTVLSIILTRSTQLLNDQRDEEFSRIKHYELINFNDTELIEKDNLFKFEAFGQYYEIELTRDDNAHIANIRHSSIKELHRHFPQKQLLQSCYYFGKVTNSDQPSKTRVALSFCENAGIRGQITAFNQTIIINPSAYFLDKEKDSKYQHKLDDEHLVYKMSDFDFSGIQHGIGIKIDDDDDEEINDLMTDSTATRRRLYNGGSNTVEVLIVVDPSRTSWAQSTYGSSWYSSLYNGIQQMISVASTEYKSTAWGSTIGTIDLKFVELEIVESFSGNYASLRAPTTSSTSVNAGEYLGVFSSWISSYKNVGTFDNAHLLTSLSLGGPSGVAYTGSICKGRTSSAIDQQGFGGTYDIKVFAHEMGHNFGMVHDGSENSCRDGLMGHQMTVGDFSSCSISEANTYFNNNNGLTCLGSDTGGSFKSNYGTGTAPNPTPRPTTNVRPTPRPTSQPPATSTWQCMNVRNLALTQYNGYWEYKGSYAGKPYYQKGLMYIYLDSSRGWYFMGPTKGGASAYGYCQYDNIQYCGGRFTLYNNNGWQSDNDCSFSQASTSSCSTTSGGCSGYSCVGITSLPSSPYGTFNGFWYNAGCHNGQAYYTSSSASGAKLQYSSSYNKWIIGPDLGGTSAYTYSPSTSSGILSTKGNWYVYNGGWNAGPSTNVYDCAGSSRNTIFDLTCLDNNEYPSQVCINTGDMDINETLWSGNRTFEHWNCENGKPIYEFVDEIIFEDETDPVIGSAVTNINVKYYLHHHEELIYSDSNETYSTWIISKDDVSTNALATCEEDNLLDCTQNSWLIDDFSDDSFKRIIDEVMSLRACDDDVDVDIEDDTNNTMKIVIIIALIVICIIICCIGYLIWRYMAKKDAEKIQKTLDGTQTRQQTELETEELSPKNKNNTTTIQQNIETDDQEIEVTTSVPITYTNV